MPPMLIIQVNLVDVEMCSTSDKVTWLAWQATEGFVCLFNVSQLFYSFPPAQKNPLSPLTMSLEDTNVGQNNNGF